MKIPLSTPKINQLSKEVIILLQDHIASLGFIPVIHFELEGCYQNQTFKKPPDFSLINNSLEQLDIDGTIIPEYWQNQWEYVSLFNGQIPLKEADNLTFAINNLPNLFAQQGIEQTLIKPVVWAGDNGKLALGCENVFSGENRAVHIPNAIQMNVSVKNTKGENVIVEANFGEYLQQCFIESSLGCSLLYLPEEEAFERFSLKTKYGLSAELCSPNDISGGHQGSIALYKEHGKHNQVMGEKAILYDHNNEIMLSESHWHDTARIEHRLGASSVHYNAYLNVIFALLNIIDALEVFENEQCKVKLKPVQSPFKLPESLFCQRKAIGAIELFKQEQWFSSSINRIEKLLINKKKGTLQKYNKMGDKLKLMVLSSYQPQAIITE